jgi:hypothetical protein
MRKLSVIAAAAAVSLVTAPASSAATIIKTQEPCVRSGTYCLSFNQNGDVPVIRRFQFTAPAAGTAVVMFHGSLYCSSSDPPFRDRMVDLVSQIVVNDAAPSRNGPGGMRQTVMLKDTPFNTDFPHDTFNLGSTRTVQIDRAGPMIFTFKIVRVRMDQAATCLVYNAAFTVIFAPAVQRR